jgi:hypothetical protein
MNIGLAIAAFLLPCGELPLWGKDSIYLPVNLYLVRATTLKVGKDPKATHQLGRLRITRVIAGPAKLVGKEFECYAGPRHTSPEVLYSGRPFEDVVWNLEVGTEGLWWVYESGPTVYPDLHYDVVERLRLNDFPYLGTKDPDWGAAELYHPRMADVKLESPWDTKWNKTNRERRRHEARAWEQAVSEVYSAKSDADRRALLRLFAAAPRSPVSGWAIALLTRGPWKEAVRFLRGLAKNDQLDGDAQATLDRELCALDGKKWRGSAERRAMLCRWMESKSTGDVFVSGCRRIAQAWLDDELDPQEYFAAVRTAVSECEKLNENERYAVERYLFVRYKKTERKDWFDFLAEIVRTAKVPWVRIHAVGGLEQFAPATEQELKVVEKLRANEPDREVQEWLDHVLVKLRTAKEPK